MSTVRIIEDNVQNRYRASCDGSIQQTIDLETLVAELSACLAVPAAGATT